jgi:hypothetical protein
MPKASASSSNPLVDALDLSPTLPEILDGDESLLAPLHTIRAETTLSKLPIHTLSKKGEVKIAIKKTDKNGSLELRWITKYGQAGQPGPLAYKLDTLIINRRIDEERQRHAELPRTIALGSLYQICRELGKGTSGKDMNDLKKALEQNAFLGIDAFIKYEDRQGERRTLEARFHRYDVIMTGGELADGSKADCVYIILSDTYHKILTQSPTRPLDYDYLKTLSAGAQRFYEMLSFKVYRALMAQEPYARLLYSEYCLNAPQKRHQAQSKMETQMNALHQPHLAAGYITRVEFHKLQDEQGAPDWELRYEVGPRARAYHKVFNREGRGGLSAVIGRPGEKTGEMDTAAAPAHAFLRYFHQRARQLADYTPASRKEVTQAQQWLNRLGGGFAYFLVDYAARSAQQTNFKMKTLGALAQYEADARRAYADQAAAEASQTREQTEIKRRQTAAETERGAVEHWLAELSPAELAPLREQKRAEILQKVAAAEFWEPEVMEASIHAGLVQDRLRELWDKAGLLALPT